MARTKNTNINTNTETKTEVKETSKTIKIIFTNNVISDYGTFTAGQEAELSEKTANKFISGGMAKVC